MRSELLPIRVRQFPTFLREAFVKRALIRKDVPRRSFQLCYFTCHSYYKYLYCSLHSLKTLGPDLRIRVLIFCDAKEMLSAAQCAAIEALHPGAKVIPWGKSQGWGAEQIASIWKAYELAAQECGDDDYVARVDSDVFLFSDWIFRAVEASRKDLVGDGHYVGFRYSQGGFYFLRGGAVRAVCRFLAANPLEAVLKKADINVEDIAAYHLIAETGQSSWLTFFMMFPDEYRRIAGFSAYQRWKFCCAHFVMKNKNLMLEAYDRDMLQPRDRAAYLEALQIP